MIPDPRLLHRGGGPVYSGFMTEQRIPYEDLELHSDKAGFWVEAHQSFTDTGAMVVFHPRLPAVALRPGQVLVIEPRDDGPHDAYNIVNQDEEEILDTAPPRDDGKEVEPGPEPEPARGWPRHVKGYTFALSDGTELVGKDRAIRAQKKLDGVGDGDA